YRSYTPCQTCGGARLKTESLLWRIGSKEDADAVLDPSKRFMPAGVQWTRKQLEALPGLCLHDLMLMPIERLRRFFDRISPLPLAGFSSSPSGGGQGWGQGSQPSPHPKLPPKGEGVNAPEVERGRHGEQQALKLLYEE